MSISTTIKIFGIRHHGPGCARSLVAALEAMQPDIVLVEGPPEGNALLPLAASAEMQPPVALMVYVPDEAGRTAVFPFAEYSPEWQAIQYALKHEIPARFIDLPQRNWLAVKKKIASNENQEISNERQVISNETKGFSAHAKMTNTQYSSLITHYSSLLTQSLEIPPTPYSLPPTPDPLDLLAHAAGLEDGEQWWEKVVEERGGDAAVFPAILDAMSAVRSTIREVDPDPRDPLEPQREAAMRLNIRKAQKDGFAHIAVVCGAWHAPALTDMPTQSSDRDLLKGLPRLKVAATWVPWSYEHLTYTSGYGAGVVSPGWYEHLWHYPQQTAPHWLARVASLLREQDLDASSAQVIDAVRLAESLAVLRGYARPGLGELNEVAQTVLCFGDALPLRLVHKRLIVAEKLGQVPPDAPTVPLQADVEATQRRLRFKPQTDAQTKDLDLRKPTDLARSALLHRLNLLNIPWGKRRRSGGRQSTFHEVWMLQWDAAFTVALVDMARWGNTLVEATTAYVGYLAAQATNLGELTDLLDRVLFADLPSATAILSTHLHLKVALSGDVTELMAAVPPLARALRYGTVRQTSGTAAFDTTAFQTILNSMVARICIGLPLACSSLDDDAANTMLKHIEGMQESLSILQNALWSEQWQDTLQLLANQNTLHGLIAGRLCRLLLDAGAFNHDEVTRRLHLALSPGTPPLHAAAWIEGFLRGSGLLLLHDDALWGTLDEWLTGLSEEDFVSTLPLLRRTFSAFPAPARRQMGERVAGGAQHAAQEDSLAVNIGRANQVLPLVQRILGLRTED